MSRKALYSLMALIILWLSLTTMLAFASAKPNRVFVTHLFGKEEVPAVDTKAQGQAIFWLSKDGESLNYKLFALNIVDILQAHIHVGPEGVNGPIVVWLYPSAPPPVLIPGMFTGLLATGTITSSSLVGPLAGMTLAELLAEMEAGNAYVNVHTTQNPGGEIRGQI